jgi:adenosylmethionine-8-amino-7-oxononanoate aminotransferase
VAGNHVLLAPPYIISDSEIEMLVTRLTQAIDSSCAIAAAC